MAESLDTNILFAVPKKGRLYERILKLLEGSGLEYRRPSRVDVARCTSLPVTLVFLPAADIAAYVGEGKVDIGITGQDIVAEADVAVNQLELLGFGKCKLAVQAPIGSIKYPKELVGKRIVTSFPNVSKKYFSDISSSSETTNIRYVSGSVEAACSLGLADGIVDLVETGTTMKAAGLEIVSVIMESQTVLISNPRTEKPDLVKLIHQRILGYITAKKYCMISYNCHRRILEDAKKITPGRKSPTVNALESEGYVAVSAMVEKNIVAKKMDELVVLGATDILTFDIQNCRA